MILTLELYSGLSEMDLKKNCFHMKALAQLYFFSRSKVSTKIEEKKQLQARHHSLSKNLLRRTANGAGQRMVSFSEN